ncbi:hypothetical protein A3Q56_00514 [Intoshia linei]|uniref:Rhabdovirus nucleocapsid domain-containing protein n=1 Tax=Intoshia linei TaxID=1819745 RepID=A0A177BBM1_9BILA|nr:hypothetical protein A3Q56_00514 [Intoshia linei]
MNSLKHFKKDGVNYMQCLVCSKRIKYINSHSHMASLRNHLKIHGDLDNVSVTPKITSILAIKKDEKFPNLPHIPYHFVKNIQDNYSSLYSNYSGMIDIQYVDTISGKWRDDYNKMLTEFRAYASSKQLKMVAACVDFLFMASRDKTYTALRLAAIATRYYEHASLSLMKEFMIEGRMDSCLWFHSVASTNVSDELWKIMEDPGLSERDSLIPYSKSMIIVARSPYSSSANSYSYVSMATSMISIGQRCL